MKASLPAGFNLESEAVVSAVPLFTDTESLSPRENEVYRVLLSDKACSVDRLLKKLVDSRGVLPALRRLIEAGAVELRERLGCAFRTRRETRIRFAPDYLPESHREELLAALERRSPAQWRLVKVLAEQSEWRRADLTERLGDGVSTALAALKKKGVVETYDVEVGRIKTMTADLAMQTKSLSPAQQVAFDGILAQFQTKNVCLLQGVTSGGKTEIYIKLIQRELKAGRQVLYLVPEIALTTQIMVRLGRVFGADMGVYHSKFPDAERVELWRKQLSAAPFGLVLGVRSSLFLPFHRLGLVIVDEEHESSYKQQDPAPRYHARDAAIVLARNYGAKVLLGTATPAMETYHSAAVTGKYGHVVLSERYGGVNLPEIIVEDIKELHRKKLMKSFLSPRLIDEVRRALSHHGQAILFQNRRGYAPVLECHVCGWTPRCTACDVPLSYHRQAGKLVCHYCGASYDVPPRCPNCEEHDLRDVGFGTEKVEETVQACFPEARVARMDLDTTRSRSAYDNIIGDFQKGRTDLLIGTQMVTKGLDFDRVRVVGILSADQMLNQPDFRAYERAFQMMTQVAGRAGRRGERGLVVLQTRQPDSPIIAQVVANDYAAMYGSQAAEREQYLYPPYCRIIDIYFKHRTERICGMASETMAALLRPHFGAELLGPDRPPVGRIQHLFIRKLVLKVRPAMSVAGVRRTLQVARQAVLARREFRTVSVYFDVGPL